MLVLFDAFCCYASPLNWVLIKRQTKLTKREISHARDTELTFFREQNWLIGLFRSKFLLNYSHFDPFVDRFKGERVLNFRWRSQRRFTHFQRDVFSSKNKAIDAGTQYSGGNKVVSQFLLRLIVIEKFKFLLRLLNCFIMRNARGAGSLCEFCDGSNSLLRKKEF